MHNYTQQQGWAMFLLLSRRLWQFLITRELFHPQQIISTFFTTSRATLEIAVVSINVPGKALYGSLCFVPGNQQLRHEGHPTSEPRRRIPSLVRAEPANQPVNLGGKISQPLKMTPTKPMHWIVALRPQSEISQVRVTENRVQISAHLRPNWGAKTHKTSINMIKYDHNMIKKKQNMPESSTIHGSQMILRFYFTNDPNPPSPRGKKRPNRGPNSSAAYFAALIP